MDDNDNWLVHEHSLYENLLSICRDAAEAEDWESVERALHELVTHLKRHVALEEEVLFPAYEAAPGASPVPTTALREEHDAIVRLLRDFAQVLTTRQRDPVLESLDRIENRMIRHHEKEEDIFLPMASHVLRDSRDQVLRKLAESADAGYRRDWDI